ncbi:hypothetical protein C8J57DRAFT_1139113 [Mycena rebaudengoi]|nr:hypothetical protein C8J57DRAFT_1139113 [Mycena rebaudengoi]
MTYSALLILSFLAVANAANDWTKPCTTGECSWDIPAANGSASGTVKIWGGNTAAISDITPAAGWEIIGCSPTALAQDIRLVCTGDKSQCQHLYSGHGAVDTLVRLPESCGKGPFARVAKAWVPKDQSLPPKLAARLARRAEPAPEVKALSLDTNFASADTSKTGTVNIAIKGANIPGVKDILASETANDSPQRRSRHSERGLGSFVKNAVKSIGSAVSNAASSVAKAASSVNNVSIDKSKELPPVDFNKNANLFKKSLSCPPITANVAVDVNAKAHAVVTVGVAASGTILPPKIKDFQIVSSLTADLNGDIHLVADLSGSLESPNLKLFEVGIPGLDFPGILSIGPTFQVNANAKATLDVNVDMTVGINYHVEKAQLFFPPKSGQRSTGAFSLGNTPLKLSADTKASATGTVEAHVIPSINLGISALSVVKATVFLNLDASAKMTLKVEAAASASATVTQKARHEDEEDEEDFSDDSDVSSLFSLDDSDHELFDLDSIDASEASVDAADGALSVVARAAAVSTAAKASFGGSFVVSAGLDVNAGAQGTFFGLFDSSTKVSLFKKTFNLLTKNFGAATKRSEEFSRRHEYSPRHLTLEARALSCLKKSAAPVALINQAVPAQAI